MRWLLVVVVALGPVGLMKRDPGPGECRGIRVETARTDVCIGDSS